MEEQKQKHLEMEGEPVAELLDQIEYPSNIGNVAAVSTRQICVLRKDWDELTHFRLEFLDADDCRAIDYRADTAYYRIVLAIAFFVAAAGLAYALLSDLSNISQESAPLIIGVIALTVFGIRFATSTHRHIIHFQMPDEILTWRSPTIDFKFKSEAAHAVREYARSRGILRDPMK